jgi:hypothetical protein
VRGTLTGSPLDAEETLGFSVLAGVRPRIEMMLLDRAGDDRWWRDPRSPPRMASEPLCR